MIKPEFFFGFFVFIALLMINRMWQELGSALCLVMVIEGLMPFALPKQWRRSMLAAVQLKDGQLRTVGFLSMAAGVLLLYWVN